MNPKAFLSQHKFATFTVLTLVFSWSCWLPILPAIQSDIFQSSAGTLTLFFAGAYGPTLCALVLSAYFDGTAGVKRLFQARLSKSAALRWGLLVMLTGPLVYLVALTAFQFFGGELGTPNHGVLIWTPVILLVSVFFGPLAEEFGWRGYALPQLDLNQNFRRANVLLGVVWAGWHAPLFWAATGTAISGMPVTVWSITMFVMAVIGSTVVYSWVFQRTNGSILIAVLLHLSLNGAGTVSAWLFPDTSSAQKPLLYGAYVLSVWFVVGLISALLHRHASLIQTKTKTLKP